MLKTFLSILKVKNHFLNQFGPPEGSVGPGNKNVKKGLVGQSAMADQKMAKIVIFGLPK